MAVPTSPAILSSPAIPYQVVSERSSGTCGGAPESRRSAASTSSDDLRNMEESLKEFLRSAFDELATAIDNSYSFRAQSMEESMKELKAEMEILKLNHNKLRAALTVGNPQSVATQETDHSVVLHQIKADSFQFSVSTSSTNTSTSVMEKGLLGLSCNAPAFTKSEAKNESSSQDAAPRCQDLLRMTSTTDKELKQRLYVGELQEEMSTLKESFDVLETTCSKLRRLFFKLSEPFLKIRNRMNEGMNPTQHKIEEPKHRTERVFRIFEELFQRFAAGNTRIPNLEVKVYFGWDDLVHGRLKKIDADDYLSQATVRMLVERLVRQL